MNCNFNFENHIVFDLIINLIIFKNNAEKPKNLIQKQFCCTNIAINKIFAVFFLNIILV